MGTKDVMSSWVRNTAVHPVPSRIKTNPHVTHMYMQLVDYQTRQNILLSYGFRISQWKARLRTGGDGITAAQIDQIKKNNTANRLETHLLFQAGKICITAEEEERMLTDYPVTLTWLYCFVLPYLSSPECAIYSDMERLLAFEYVARLHSMTMIETRTVRFGFFQDLDFWFHLGSCSYEEWVKDHLDQHLVLIRRAIAVIANVVYSTVHNGAAKRGAMHVQHGDEKHAFDYCKNNVASMFVVSYTEAKYDRDNNRVKYALHVCWPNMVVNQNMAFLIRLLCIHSLYTLLPEYTQKVDWYDVVDRTVYVGSGLRVIGALKGDACCGYRPGNDDSCPECIFGRRISFRPYLPLCVCRVLQVTAPSFLQHVHWPDHELGLNTIVTLDMHRMRECIAPVMHIMSHQSVLKGFETPDHVAIMLVNTCVHMNDAELSTEILDHSMPYTDTVYDMRFSVLCKHMAWIVRNTVVRRAAGTPMATLLRAKPLSALLGASRWVDVTGVDGDVTQSCCETHASTLSVRPRHGDHTVRAQYSTLLEKMSNARYTNGEPMVVVETGDARYTSIASWFASFKKVFISKVCHSEKAKIYTVLTKSRMCMNIDRQHRSNHVYFVIDINGVRQRCFSPRCAQFCSHYMQLCDSVYKVLFGDRTLAAHRKKRRATVQQTQSRVMDLNVPFSELTNRRGGAGGVGGIGGGGGIVDASSVVQPCSPLIRELDHIVNVEAVDDIGESDVADDTEYDGSDGDSSSSSTSVGSNVCPEHVPLRGKRKHATLTDTEEMGEKVAPRTDAWFDKECMRMQSLPRDAVWIYVPECSIKPSRSWTQVSNKCVNGIKCYYANHTAEAPYLKCFFVHREKKTCYCDHCFQSQCAPLHWA